MGDTVTDGLLSTTSSISSSSDVQVGTFTNFLDQ